MNTQDIYVSLNIRVCIRALRCVQVYKCLENNVFVKKPWNYVSVNVSRLIQLLASLSCENVNVNVTFLTFTFYTSKDAALKE